MMSCSRYGTFRFMFFVRLFVDCDELVYQYNMVCLYYFSRVLSVGFFRVAFMEFCVRCKISLDLGSLMDGMQLSTSSSIECKQACMHAAACREAAGTDVEVRQDENSRS